MSAHEVRRWTVRLQIREALITPRVEVGDHVLLPTPEPCGTSQALRYLEAALVDLREGDELTLLVLHEQRAAPAQVHQVSAPAVTMAWLETALLEATSPSRDLALAEESAAAQPQAQASQPEEPGSAAQEPRGLPVGHDAQAPGPPTDSHLLMQVATELSTVNGSEDAARAVAEQLRVAFDASSVVLCVSGRGGVLRVTAHSGMALTRLAEFQDMSPNLRVPVTDAARTRQPVLIETRAQLMALYPHLSEVVEARHQAWAALPLIVDEQVLAVVYLSFLQARAFPEATRLLMSAVARQAGLALARVRLFETERGARLRVEHVLELTRSLEFITRSVSRALSAWEVGQAVVNGALRALAADVTAVFTVEEAGRWLTRVAGTGMKGQGFDRYARIPLDADAPLVEAVRSALPIWIEGGSDYATRYPASYARLAEVQDVRAFSVASLPLRVEGRVLGALAVSYYSDRRFDEDERRFLVLAADHCALALARVELFDAERRARALAEQAAARAEQAERKKDEFLAMLGHELRNPLAPIVTALQLLRAQAEPTRELSIIGRQVEHLQRLVDDLLDISRITRGKVELRQRSLDLADVVAEAIDMVSPALEQKGLHLNVQLQSPLPVRGDAVRLSQVFSNLLNNACKYSHAGGRVDIVGWRDGAQVSVALRDHGVGIAPELLPHIFDMFAQGPQPIARSQGGLGLGLTIARQLSELHGGSLEAHSQGLGTGSVFTLRLPLAEGVEEPAPRSSLAVLRPFTHASDLRILLVDDNEDAAELLAAGLKRFQFSVTVAHDGPSALTMAEQLQPQIVCLDIGLPGMDGYEVARRLRATGRPMRLIAITGYGQDSDRARALAAGFDVHLVKPVALPELLRQCSESLTAL